MDGGTEPRDHPPARDDRRDATERDRDSAAQSDEFSDLPEEEQRGSREDEPPRPPRRPLAIRHAPGRTTE